MKMIRQIGMILVLTGILCQSSSAQETTNSTKATKVQKKVARKAKRYTALGRFEDAKINESSGIATARPAANGAGSNAIWTFNDSGGEAKLFRVNTNGKTEATLKLKGARNRDWETMCGFAVDGEQFLAVGDVGDNLFRQKSYEIYVVPEPVLKPKVSKKGKLKVRDLKAESSKIEFRYEDGSHNCEAMSYNSDDNTFWFIEKVYVDDKRKTAPGIYVLSNPLITPSKAADADDAKSENVAKRVADFPVRNVTGMAFSPDNQRLVIRNYFGAWLYEKSAGKTWQQTVVETKAKALALPLQTQGEAICFGVDGKTLLVTSEFKNAIIWQINLVQEVSKEKNEAGK